MALACLLTLLVLHSLKSQLIPWDPEYQSIRLVRGHQWILLSLLDHYFLLLQLTLLALLAQLRHLDPVYPFALSGLLDQLILLDRQIQ